MSVTKVANFAVIKTAVAKQFKEMVATGLYYVELDKDALWQTYLASFPAWADPLYRKRTEHDCSCCKSFIRAAGGIVTIRDNQLVTLWDCQTDDAYQPVVDALAKTVRQHAIANIFLHREPVVGVAKNFEDTTSGVKTWEHFFVNLPAEAHCKGGDIGPKQADARADHDVLLRSLTEIDLGSIDTVLELIDQNSLYRGEENRYAVAEFRKLKQAFSKSRSAYDLFVWAQVRSAKPAVARIRNTAIGTLLTALSEGEDIEKAVKAFEAVVAPTNYKRPTALVTKAMIQKAQQTIAELGLTSALERRYATIDDITVNNVLFADRQAKQEMNVFEELASKAPEKSLKSFDKVEEVPIDQFLAKILPKATAIDVLFENRLTTNLASLIAPVDPTAKSMFKWPNNFSWAYAGEVADSIKERVKRAGGSVTGDLCCRLAWNNTDDLDFHMHEPGGDHIYFTNRRSQSKNGGVLDLDANGADGLRSDPAENIVYADRRKMHEGLYYLSVNQFARRQTDNVGLGVEIEFDGQVLSIAYDKPMNTGSTVEVAQIRYSKGQFEIVKSLPSSITSKTVWGVPTQTFRRVRAIMLSPNHWDDRAVGNKHYFFMLDGCLNEGRARGFFNEFLNEELNKHRKVLEVVGAKLKTEESDRQLSGLGFSSTQRNSVLCRVQGAFSRTVRVTF
jgi:hypothetical protein